MSDVPQEAEVCYIGLCELIKLQNPDCEYINGEDLAVVFDSNGDGALDYSEFAVLYQRAVIDQDLVAGDIIWSTCGGDATGALTDE